MEFKKSILGNLIMRNYWSIDVNLSKSHYSLIATFGNLESPQEQVVKYVKQNNQVLELINILSKLC